MNDFGGIVFLALVNYIIYKIITKPAPTECYVCKKKEGEEGVQLYQWPEREVHICEKCMDRAKKIRLIFKNYQGKIPIELEGDLIKTGFYRRKENAELGLRLGAIMG